MCDKVEARMRELQRLDSEFKYGKRDTAPSTDEWLQVFIKRAFIRAKMRKIEQILSVLIR